MALVKCNHCRKETKNDNPLFLGKCTRCNKVLDKNLEKIEDIFQNSGKNNVSIKDIEDCQKLFESIRQYRKYNKIACFIIVFIFAFFIRVPAIVFLIIGLIHRYIDMSLKDKHINVMNRLTGGVRKNSTKRLLILFCFIMFYICMLFYYN